MRKGLLFIISIFIFFGAFSINQSTSKDDTNLNIHRIDPPNWWAGMNEESLELLIQGEGIEHCKISIDYPGVTITKREQAENPNYLYLTLQITDKAKPGEFSINFTNDKKSISMKYELKERSKDPKRIQGLSSSDLIYLILPDRFANGDESNDIIKGTNEPVINRDSMFYRHGGDLQGIMDHLDYVKEIGATALWINPLLENDQPYESYHGYAITDHYLIDPRFGTNEKYLELVNKCHDEGLKVIMDVVYNHVGDEHYLYKNLPDKNWIHRFDNFTRTTYRAPTLMDSYVSEKDRKIFAEGWFDHHMPDLNQKDPHLAKYLIQNSIWWIEYAGIDGFRIDTYAYSDQKFMSDLTTAILKEYPCFGMFGETWVHGIPIQGFFTEKNGLNEEFDSNLPGVTDFQLYYAINEALNNEQGWTEGVSKIYYTLAQDFIYNDPTKNVVFLDNHDLSRFYSMVEEDIDKFKQGITLLLTTRGIPMLYYGTEILMKNYADPDGKVREDFPGGWKGDTPNKFSKEGRTELENDAFDFIKKLANYRKENVVLQTGKLMQFIPEHGVYVYFRYNDDKTIMVILNTSSKEKVLDMSRFDEKTKGFNKMKNIQNEEVKNIQKNITISANSSLILEIL